MGLLHVKKSTRCMDKCAIIIFQVLPFCTVEFSKINVL